MLLGSLLAFESRDDPLGRIGRNAALGDGPRVEPGVLLLGGRLDFAAVPGEGLGGGDGEVLGVLGAKGGSASASIT